jgi:YfiH family protein
MPFHQPDSLRYFTFASLDLPEIVHASLSRRGGVSPEPWRSLNLGGTVGDEPERVRTNRRRALQAFGLPFDSVYDVYQVHGSNVVCTRAPRDPSTPHIQADAILTDQPGVTLMMRFADCVPIFLYDPHRKVVGLAHAGWQGTLRRTAACAVQAMQDQYGSQPADILAGIGPSIGPHHYPVGPEVTRQVEQVFGGNSKNLLRFDYGAEQNSGVQFDLWKANRLVLEQAGVSQIEIAEICTACHLEDWYSHRGEKGRTGRFGVLIALK